MSSTGIRDTVRLSVVAAMVLFGQLAGGEAAACTCVYTPHRCALITSSAVVFEATVGLVTHRSAAVKAGRA